MFNFYLEFSPWFYDLIAAWFTWVKPAWDWHSSFTQWRHGFYEKPSPLLLSSPVATQAFLVSCPLLNFIAGSYIWLTQPFCRDGNVKNCAVVILLCTFLSSLFLPVWHLSLCSFLPLLKRFSDIILATILATKSDICGKKFELKIDNVRFVGHPTLLQHPPVIQVCFVKAPPPNRTVT